MKAHEERSDVRELMAQLTCRAIHLDRSNRAHGQLQPLEIAGMLAGLSREAQIAALYRYCGDQSVETEMFYHAYLRAIDVVAQNKWEVPRGRGLVRTLTKIALIEALDMPICRRCDGHMSILVDSKWIKCSWCMGTGRRGLTSRERYEMAGIRRDSWYRKWARRYELILSEIIRWSVDLDNSVIEKLKSELIRNFDT